MATIETGAVVYEWLVTSGTSLYTANAARVCQGRAPDGFLNAESYIVFHLIERTHPDVPLDMCEVVCKCYGGTDHEEDAETLHRLLHARLHGARGATATGRLARCEFTTGQLEADPDMGWPVYIGIYDAELRSNS